MDISQNLPKCQPGGCESRVIIKISRLYPLGAINIYNKGHGNPSDPLMKMLLIKNTSDQKSQVAGEEACGEEMSRHSTAVADSGGFPVHFLFLFSCIDWLSSKANRSIFILTFNKPNWPLEPPTWADQCQRCGPHPNNHNLERQCWRGRAEHLWQPDQKTKQKQPLHNRFSHGLFQRAELLLVVFLRLHCGFEGIED